MKVALTAIVLALCWCAGSATAQTDPSDSITVEQAVRLTLENHPSIRQAEYGMTASEAQINVKRSARYPDLSLEGEYVRIGPVPQFSLPGQGTLNLAPYDNYDLHLGLRQTLYDFGRTSEAIRLAETSRQTAVDNIDLIKFNLAYGTISVFNSILILHRRIAVLDDQLQTLKQHLDISIRKMEAGTATDFDTLTIQVRIAVARSNRIDAVRGLEIQEIMFRQLTGLPAGTPVNLRGTFATDKITLESDSLMAVAGTQRPELVLSRDIEANAAAHSRVVSLKDKPELGLMLTTGFKNGYEPNLNSWRGNYAARLELNIPVFNGRETKFQVVEAEARLNAVRAHTADLERQVFSEVHQAMAAVNASLEKLSSTETQVYQAEKAVSMARVRYAAGVITNLDLLDAETTLSEAKLVRLRAYYDYTVSLNALDRATGRKVWQ